MQRRRRRVHVAVEVRGRRGPERRRDVVAAAAAVAVVVVAAGRSQDLVHEGDVGDGQTQRLDSGQTLLVRKSRNLKRKAKLFCRLQREIKDSTILVKQNVVIKSVSVVRVF